MKIESIWDFVSAIALSAAVIIYGNFISDPSTIYIQLWWWIKGVLMLFGSILYCGQPIRFLTVFAIGLSIATLYQVGITKSVFFPVFIASIHIAGFAVIGVPLYLITTSIRNYQKDKSKNS